MSRVKTAVVTGGTRGIGKAIALKLAREGYRVLALFARDRDSASALEEQARVENLKLSCLRGDLTQDAKFQAVVAGIKEFTTELDVLVHSAASGVHREAVALTAKHLAWTFDVNVLSIHKLMLELIDLMPKGSRIIGLTSQGGTRVIPFYAAVGTTKGALESLFRHYAQELAPRGIAVNLVCPGLVMTDAVDAFPDKERRIDVAVGETPTGRLTTPEEVAEVVSFLASPAAGQIVGQTIVIDGGKGGAV